MNTGRNSKQTTCLCFGGLSTAVSEMSFGGLSTAVSDMKLQTSRTTRDSVSKITLTHYGQIGKVEKWDKTTVMHDYSDCNYIALTTLTQINNVGVLGQLSLGHTSKPVNHNLTPLFDVV